MTTTLDQRPARTLLPLDRSRPVAGRPATRPAASPTARTGWERNSDRRDRLHLGLSELFRTRGDLDGVSPVADVVAEDLLWSA